MKAVYEVSNYRKIKEIIVFAFLLVVWFRRFLLALFTKTLENLS